MADAKHELLVDGSQQDNPQLQAEKARQHAHNHGLGDQAELIARGAVLARFGVDAVQMSEDERRILSEEKTHRFKQR